MEIENQGDNSGTPSPVVQASTQDAPSQTAVAPNSNTQAPVTNDVPLHKDARFKEVIGERNHYRQEYERLMNEQNRNKYEQFHKSQESQDVEELKNLGLDEATSKKFYQFVDKVAQRKAEQFVRPLQNETFAMKVANAVENFRSQTPDFDKYKDDMALVYSELSPADKQWASSSPHGIRSLYNEAKVRSLAKIEKDAHDKGVQTAYQNQALKNSVAPSSGSSAPNAGVVNISPQDIKNMPIEEFIKYQKQIDKAMEDKFRSI